MTRTAWPCVTSTLLLLTGAASFARGPWIEARSSHYSVFYQAGFDADAQRVRSWADDAERVMQEKYGVVPTHYRMSIYLQPTLTSNANANTAHNQCCHSAGGKDSTGTIDMLAPSTMKNSTAMSSLGIPKSSDDYHAKVFVSEYIPIGHYEAQNARPPGGWKYYEAPNWFVQGLQEYDAIFHSTAGNRDSTTKLLSVWAVSHRDTFSCCTADIGTTDDYNGGLTILTFLAVQFGEGIHNRMLRSSAPTFADALTEQTKPYTRRQLFEQFQQWLAKGAPARRER